MNKEFQFAPCSIPLPDGDKLDFWDLAKSDRIIHNIEFKYVHCLILSYCRSLTCHPAIIGPTPDHLSGTTYPTFYQSSTLQT